MVLNIVFYFILSYHIKISFSKLSYLILSYPIPSYPILSYPILSYLILSYPILSYLILSYYTDTSELPDLFLLTIQSYPVLRDVLEDKDDTVIVLCPVMLEVSENNSASGPS